MGTKRLVSLDVFRGLTMAAMNMVNNPGSWKDAYAPLLYALANVAVLYVASWFMYRRGWFVRF